MKKENKIFNLYCLISFGGIFSFIIILIIENTDAAKWLVMEHNFEYQFSDFFRQIVYASDLKNIYFNTVDVPFPPLAYLFFYILYKVNPINVPIELASWEIIQDYQYNLLIYVMCMIMLIIFLAEIIKIILQKYKERKTIFFIVLILLSAPFMSGAIERGNIVILVCILLLWAMYLMDSEVLWKKELALIMIAIAAGLKIYPAIFGVIYLRERRWKEAGRLLIYGMFFFFFPFIFTGGIEGLRQYMNVLSVFRDINVYRWTNIRCYVLTLLHSWSGEEYQLNTNLGIIVENIYFVFSLLSILKSKEKWKSILFMSGIMTLYVPNSYRYVSIYMLLPLVFWLKWQEKGRWNEYIYCVLFSLIFTIPTYAYFINGEVDFCIFTPIYLLMIYSMIETWFLENNTGFVAVSIGENYRSNAVSEQ